MSDNHNAPSEQPAPESAPVQTPGAQPAVTDHSATLATLDQTQLGNLLFGEPQGQPASEAVPAEGTPPAATPAEGAQPAAEVKPPAAEPEEASSLRRLALGGIPMSERQQMAEVTRMIRDGEAATQIEALTKMGVIQPAAPAGEQPPAVTPAAEPEAPPTAPTSVLELETAIADLRAQRKAAKQDFDEDEVDRLETLISQNERLLIRAELQAESQQVENRSYQSDYLAAVDAMEEKYEWTTDENDPRYQLLDDKVTAARARNDAALQEPDFILKFAGQVDALGKPAPASQTAPAPPPPPPPVPGRIVGGGVAPGHSEARQPTPEEARLLVQKASKEELAAALFG